MYPPKPVTQRIYLIPLIFLALIIFKKDYDVLVEGSYGGGRRDQLFHIEENLRGGYVAVGFSKSKSEGKEDMYVVVTDQDCKPILEKRAGRRLKDVANSVAVANDGSYVVAGFTESPGGLYRGGERDAVILKLDESLRDIQLAEESYNTSGAEHFNDIITVGDVGYVAVGAQDGQIFGVRLDPSGNLIWQYRCKDFDLSEAMAVSRSANGDLFVVGNKKEGDSNQALVVCLSSAGEQKWARTYGVTENLIRCNDILALQGDRFAIGGEAMDPTRDGAFFIIEASGDLVSAIPRYGDRWEDAVYGLAQDYDGDFYMTGLSYARNDNRENSWIFKVDEEGKRIWKNDERNFLGGGKTDQMFDLIHSSQGNIVLAGFRNTDTKSSEAWIVKLKEDIPDRHEVEADDLEWGSAGVIDGDRNEIITSNERAYLRLELKNKTKLPFYGLFARISSDNQEGFKVFDKIKVGEITEEGESSLIIPVIGGDELNRSSQNIRVQLYQNGRNGEIQIPLAPFEFTINTDRSAQADLDIQNVEFITDNDDSAFRRGDRAQLAFNVRNKGNRSANRVSLRFEIPEAVNLFGAKWRSLGTIDPGETERVYLEFEPTFTYFDDSINFGISILDSLSREPLERQATLSLQKPEIRPQPVQRELLAEWASLTSGDAFEVASSRFGFLANLYANEPLDRENLVVLVNDEVVEIRDDQLTEIKQTQDDPNLYNFQYQYRTSFFLGEGSNQIALELSRGDLSIRTQAVQVKYTPIRSRLHVLSIGVPIDAVKEYSANDATLFAEIFTAAGENYFVDVRADILSERRQTFERKIANEFWQLKQDYHEGIIQPDDALLVFISSHGSISTPNTFQIKAGNFDGLFPDLTSIDYIEEVERFLRQVNCQKVVFLDVFNHFSEEDEDKNSKEDEPELSTAFLQLMDKETNTTPVILSCSRGEASFENPDLEGGVFAHSIFNALQRDVLTRVDVDQNNVITISEFFDRLLTGMKDVAASKERQTPYFEKNGLEADFGLSQVRSF